MTSNQYATAATVAILAGLGRWELRTIHSRLQIAGFLIGLSVIEFVRSRLGLGSSWHAFAWNAVAASAGILLVKWWIEGPLGPAFEHAQARFSAYKRWRGLPKKHSDHCESRLKS